jgi:group I intron endonuclease
MGIIYIATNKINGKKYIGKTARTLNERLRGHKCDANKGVRLPFCRAIKKYGTEGFCFEEFVFPDEDLNKIEIEMIFKMKTQVPNGYNISEGGEGTLGRKYKMTDEHKAKIALGRIGKKHTEETKNTIRQKKLGKKPPKFTKEHKKSMALSATEAWKKRVKKYLFTSPEGKEYISEDGFRKFCNEHGIRRDMMYKVLLNKVKQGNHRGWKVKEI